MARIMNFRNAISEALAEEMKRDKDVFIIGQDVRVSVFGQTRGLVKEFGEDRVFNTPISENAITGVAMGAGLMSMRPVLELMYGDFCMLAMDHLYNNIGQWRYITGNMYNVPITIRTTVGAGFRMGYAHSQCIESLLANAPGLIICAPSTPADVKGLLKSAIRSNDPVIVLEHKKLLLGNMKGEVFDENYTIPFGKAALTRKGKDVTVVATMHMLHEAMKASEELLKNGIDTEIIDPRTIVPLDKDAILQSVEKTGRLVIAEEGRIRNGLGSEISAMVTSEIFYSLKAPIKRVAAPMIPIPGSACLEDLYIPNKDSIVKAVKSLFD